MVPGCAHNERALHYAVTTDYRPPILTIPRTGGHQAPRDWSSVDDVARRRSFGFVNYCNFIPCALSSTNQQTCCRKCERYKSATACPPLEKSQIRRQKAKETSEIHTVTLELRRRKTNGQQCAGQQVGNRALQKYRIHKTRATFLQKFVC